MPFMPTMLERGYVDYCLDLELVHMLWRDNRIGAGLTAGLAASSGGDDSSAPQGNCKGGRMARGSARVRISCHQGRSESPIIRVHVYTIVHAQHPVPQNCETVSICDTGAGRFRTIKKARHLKVNRRRSEGNQCVLPCMNVGGGGLSRAPGVTRPWGAFCALCTKFVQDHAQPT